MAIANKNCGSALRTEREWAGKSLRQTAKEFGISAAYLSDIERGRRAFPISIKGSFSLALRHARILHDIFKEGKDAEAAEV